MGAVGIICGSSLPTSPAPGMASGHFARLAPSQRSGLCSSFSHHFLALLCNFFLRREGSFFLCPCLWPLSSRRAGRRLPGFLLHGAGYLLVSNKGPFLLQTSEDTYQPDTKPRPPRVPPALAAAGCVRDGVRASVSAGDSLVDESPGRLGSTAVSSRGEGQGQAPFPHQ